MAVAILGLAASLTLPLAFACGLVGGAAEMAHTASNMAMLQMSALKRCAGASRASRCCTRR